MQKYRNISSQELVVIGFGVVQPGGFVLSDTNIENPDLELIGNEAPAVAPEAMQPAPEIVQEPQIAQPISAPQEVVQEQQQPNQ